MFIVAIEFNREQILNTTVENLIKGGVITETEKEQTKKNLSALPLPELLATMVESHEIKEFAEANKN
jgi:hypothetical protein